jgi:hypothetical protein
MVLRVSKTVSEFGAKPLVEWERLPDDFILPDDPVENIEQPFLAAALTDALGTANLIHPEMLIASNFGLVARVNGKTIVKAPDWLWVSQVNPVSERSIRRSYTQFLEGERVGIVMEFLSDEELGELSVRSTYPYGKLYFYEQILGVPIYVVFDPYSLKLEVRQLQENGVYQLQEPNLQGRYWIPGLQLFLGLWQGERAGHTTHWLRWWDEVGNLLLWGAELATQEQQRAEQAQQAQQAAEQERQRAEKLTAKLRELGIDPNEETE